jgi:hypothetical protein
MDLETYMGSKEVYGPETDLFNLPPTNISVVSGDYQQLTPTAALVGNQNGVIGFRIEKSNSFLDLRDTFLYVKARIVKRDGSAILADEIIAPGNLFLHTLFKEVKIKFNSTPVVSADGYYAYQAWMRNQLKVSAGAKESELSKEIYYKDTEPDDTSSTNYGFQKRLALAAGGKSFEMIGKIAHDIFEQERLIPNNVDVDIEFTRNTADFCLQTDSANTNDYRVDIQEMNLYVKRRVLEQDLFNSIQQKFKKGNLAKYPVARTAMRALPIFKGSRNCSTPSLYTGTLPRFMCLGVVDGSAESGNIKRSPFNFKNNSMSKLTITFNGQPALYRALECNFEDGEYLMAYNTLFGRNLPNVGNGITMQDYLKGNTLYVFDFNRAMPNELQGEQTGTVGLEMSFSKPVEELQTLVIMIQMQGLIEIDGSGRVEVTY